MVKLTPNVTDIAEISRAVVDSGADCISLVNTYVGLTIDVPKRRPTLSTVTGGLSGPAIKPLALAMVYRAAGAVDVPVVGMGGISNAQDALEFIMAGATAVQVGTANFTNPQGLRGRGRGGEGVHGTAGRRHLVQYRGGGQDLGSGPAGMIVPPKLRYDRISSVIIMRISHLTESRRKGPRRG